MRIIIAGSRTFSDYPRLKKIMDKLTSKLEKVLIMSGHAKGADQLGERWANERYHTYEIYHADWDKLGKSAGPIRNSEMIAADPDVVVAFYDGKSPGTKDLITKARLKGIKTIVVRF